MLVCSEALPVARVPVLDTGSEITTRQKMQFDSQALKFYGNVNNHSKLWTKSNLINFSLMGELYDFLIF